MQPAGRFSGKTKMQECRNAGMRMCAGTQEHRRAGKRSCRKRRTAKLREDAEAQEHRRAGKRSCRKRRTAKLREAVKAQERRTRSVKTEMEVSDESGMVAEGALQGL